MADPSAQHAPAAEPSASTSSVSGIDQPSLRSPTESDSSLPIGRAIDERNGFELQQIPTQEDNEMDDLSSGSISSGECRVTTRRTVSRSSSSRQPRKGVLGSIQRFWANNVSLTVPQKSNRDHFALERTFLAYIRTSITVAMQGVLVAQLFRLQRSTAVHAPLGYFRVGIPLAVTCHVVAILVALMGAHRFWRQQSAVAHGKVHAGGWELNGIGIFIGLNKTVLNRNIPWHNPHTPFRGYCGKTFDSTSGPWRRSPTAAAFPEFEGTPSAFPSQAESPYISGRLHPIRRANLLNLPDNIASQLDGMRRPQLPRNLQPLRSPIDDDDFLRSADLGPHDRAQRALPLKPVIVEPGCTVSVFITTRAGLHPSAQNIVKSYC
ncbi:DUF202 domain-containing protein [Aspergillus thermomutatus]|uniref:DUF202 domain-containing protein n=1 Tax=Aspergillus thermomutatus TaxID=41047 RepID=A0A397G589_ASPTH|nr:uncharacterized protein CDV56_100092 [Aspergillus thermomutatus]RHZ46211.1 hypothetical protein CDV56_100092 [Aspergillus thermomutatus]